MNKKYEYKIINMYDSISQREYEFNDLGEDGWKLFSLDGEIAYFIREI